MEIRDALKQLIARRDLTEAQTEELFGQITDGKVSPGQLGALLAALACKGECVAEVVGAARALRARAKPFVATEGARLVDTCGTGGDAGSYGGGTVNISTVAALVVAACGVKVVKHGNRAVSSRAGSADLLEALGIGVRMSPERSLTGLRELGFAFLFAPDYHDGTRHATPVRKELGVRTIFNVLGPLTNPAGVTHQLVGVFDRRWCRPLAEALGRLGSERALVVHGEGGLDELSPFGETSFAELLPTGEVKTGSLRPADFGLEACEGKGLAGGSAEENAAIVKQLVLPATERVANGTDARLAATRTAVLMAAAATLVIAGAENSHIGACRRAAQAIDRGDVAALVARLVAFAAERV